MSSENIISKGTHYKILSIEDDELYAGFLEKLVTSYFKASFHHKAKPNDAFDWLVENKDVDLLLLDLELPQMDGLKVLRNIRIQLNMKNLKIIPCTTLSSKNLIANLAKQGISDFIVKTAPTKVIAEKIKKVLES